MVAIGKFLKPFGVKGQLKFLSYSGETQHLHAVSLFFIEDNTTSGYKEFTIDSWDISTHSIRCKIKNFDNPEKARELAGVDVYVSKDQAAPLNENEYYISDLIGTKIYYQKNCIGLVSHIYSDAYAPLIEIQQCVEVQTNNTAKQKKALVPFLSRFFSSPYTIQENQQAIDVLDLDVVYWS